MGHPVHQGRDLPEHMSPSGDQVVVELIIRVYASGALSVHGPIEDKAWCLAALENAKDAVKGHHAARSEIVVPCRDVAL